MSTATAAPRSFLINIKRIGTGLCFILFPILFVFAFAVHPGLLNPHKLTDVEVILRMHHNTLLTIGHVLVLFDAAILIVVTLELMHLLDHTPAAWAGFIGAAITVLSGIALAAEKGAECLTMSAMDTLPENQFTQMMPGLVAIVSKQGWMVLIWGVALIAVGLTIQAIGLLATGVFPRWQAALLLGIWLLGVPDGMEIVSLVGTILLTIALVPYGIHLLGEQQSQPA